MPLTDGARVNFVPKQQPDGKWKAAVVTIPAAAAADSFDTPMPPGPAGALDAVD